MNQTPEPGEDARDVKTPEEEASESGAAVTAGESAPAAAWRVIRQMVHGSLHSPLLKYLGYSLVIHMVVVAALSGVVMALPGGGEEAAGPADTDAATAAADAGKPAAPTDPTRPTGSADDYYKKQGGGKTASPEDIPRAPSIGGGLD